MLTNWALLLLVAFLVLGLSRMQSRDAMRYAVILVTLVLVVMRFYKWR